MATNALTLAGKKVSLQGAPVSVAGRIVTPNGLGDAVFEGGGVKGIGHVGALAYFERIGVQWVNVAGTSAGAIVAALVAANYSVRKIRDIMFGLDFRSFMDESLIDRIPLVGKVISLLFEKGIYEGDYLEKTLDQYLRQNGVRKFRDLVIPEEPPDSKHRYRLRVVASDISRGKMLVLPQDIRDYGEKPDDLSVARAVRMSMSLPFVFEPVVMTYKKDGRRERSYIVDGGLLSNYPVQLFDESGTPSWPTFGFELRESARPKRAKIRGPFSLGLALFNTMFSAMDRRYIEEKSWDRTVPIPTLGVGTADFDISDRKKQVLYDAGYKAAESFARDWWDWDRHVRARRRRWRMESVPATVGRG